MDLCISFVDWSIFNAAISIESFIYMQCISIFKDNSRSFLFFALNFVRNLFYLLFLNSVCSLSSVFSAIALCVRATAYTKINENCLKGEKNRIATKCEQQIIIFFLSGRVANVKFIANSIYERFHFIIISQPSNIINAILIHLYKLLTVVCTGHSVCA